MGRLTAIVLGSAAGGGFPQWNCRCPACELAWHADPRVRPRTQTGLAVSAGDGWILINASPDLREQIRATPALHPRSALRGSPIRAVVLTGAEIDQIAGLLSLREGTPFALYATLATHAAIAENTIFAALASVTRCRVPLEEPFTLADIEAELFAVPGKVPLYRETGEAALEIEGEVSVGVELRYGSARLLFVPGAAAVSDAMRRRLERADVILFDGTLYTDDEMRRLGVSTKTGRRMGHMPVAGENGSLAALGGLTGRRIYIHINNTNPIHILGSSERAAVEAAGWEIAEDGMEIVL
jgi:pyrroloquinoline quinone biosynthesis protein B